MNFTTDNKNNTEINVTYICSIDSHSMPANNTIDKLYKLCKCISYLQTASTS